MARILLCAWLGHELHGVSEALFCRAVRFQLTVLELPWPSPEMSSSLCLSGLGRCVADANI